MSEQIIACAKFMLGCSGYSPGDLKPPGEYNAWAKQNFEPSDSFLLMRRPPRLTDLPMRQFFIPPGDLKKHHLFHNRRVPDPARQPIKTRRHLYMHRQPAGSRLQRTAE